MIREIVVPNLPATIGHLLNFCSISDPASSISEIEIIAPVLEALRDILKSHSVTFRPFAQKTHILILSVLSSPSSSIEEERLAREIFALLHLCASGSSRGTVLATTDPSSGPPGNKATAVADEWTRGFKSVIQDAHSTLNVLFRSVLEDSDYSRSGSFGGKISGGETTLEASGSSMLGLANWKGILEGVDRVSVLLRILQSFFTLPSTAQVSIPVGQLVDLTTRIFSVAPSTAQINPAVERTERELMFARLPELYRNGLDLVSTVVERLGILFAPFAFLAVEQIAYVFGEGSWSAEIKVAVYCLLNSLLDNFGTGLAKTTVHSIHPILTATCEDLFPSPPPPTVTTNLSTTTKSGKQQRNANGNTSGQNFHADAFLSVLPTAKFTFPGLVAAAETLLATALAKLPTAHIRSELRTKMDRTAVLTGNTEAMLASVLFPPAGARRGGSILPHLVGAGSGKGVVVEGIVRPRLPIVWTGKGKGEGEDDEMEDVEEEEEEEESEEDDGDDVQEVDALGSSKNPYTEETLAGESPYKRQKVEFGVQTGTVNKQTGSMSAHDETEPKSSRLLDDLTVYIREQEETNSTFATQPVITKGSTSTVHITPVSNIAAASPSFTSTTVISSTSAVNPTEAKQRKVEVTKATAFGAEDSDDDIEIPEIVMGESSSEDEGDNEGEEED